MKNSKFWKWFIPLILLASFGIYNLLNFANNLNTKEETAKVVSNIKDDYETLNDHYLKVEINKNNVYYKASIDEIKKVLDSEGTIIFANPKDNVSRKIITILNNVVEQTSIDKVYYFDSDYLNDEFKTYLKDKLQVDILPGTLITVSKGEILKIYYPNAINNDKELKSNEESKLKKEYQEIIENVIEKCDESC